MHVWWIAFALAVMCAWQGGEASDRELQTHKYVSWSAGKFSFASYYADHMVLQRSPQQASLWGYAPVDAIGKSVKVTLQSSNYSLSYDAKVVAGPLENIPVWRVKLKAMDPSFDPYTITANLESESIKISDVLFGDVWLCSGQSNMVFIVSSMFNNSYEYKIAPNFPNIRLLLVRDNLSPSPLYDIKEYEYSWSLPSQKSLANFSSVCWLYSRHVYSKMKIPMGMITSAWGGTPIEAWSSPDSLKACGLSSLDLTSNVEGADIFDDSIPGEPTIPPPQTPMVLYNAMIHPFLNMSIYGVLWYQGEQNGHTATRDLYNCTFPAMISDWRAKWQGATGGQTAPMFPFGFVQLGPDANISVTQGFTDIRWHQTADVGYVPNSRLENVFMAVAIDLTDLNSPFGSVHYRDKGTVGQRLSLSGLSVAYKQPEILHQGPWPTYAQTNGSNFEVRIIYDGATVPITVKASAGYEICCKATKDLCVFDSKEWIRTSIIRYDFVSVTIDAKPCANQLLNGLRYIWRTTPCVYKKCPVYSVENELPAPPYVYDGEIADFRTASSSAYIVEL